LNPWPRILCPEPILANDTVLMTGVKSRPYDANC